MLLAGQPRAPFGEGLPRVLQEQPLDGDRPPCRGRRCGCGRPAARRAARARAGGPPTGSAACARGPRACRAPRGACGSPGRAAGGGRPPARGAARRRGARSSRGSARGRAGPGRSPARSSSLSEKGRPSSTRLRGAQVAAQTAEAPQGQLLFLDGLDLAAGREPQQVARAVAPGVAAVASGQHHHHGARPPVGPRERRDEAVALQERRGGEAPVAEGVVRGGVGAGKVDDEAGPHLLDDRREGLAQRGEEAARRRRPSRGRSRSRPRRRSLPSGRCGSRTCARWGRRRRRDASRCRRGGRGPRRARAPRSPGPAGAGSAIATSLKTQNPSPASGSAWWKPPPRWTATPPVRRARRVAWMVPARHQPLQVERRLRLARRGRRRRGSGPAPPAPAPRAGTRGCGREGGSAGKQVEARTAGRGPAGRPPGASRRSSPRAGDPSARRRRRAGSARRRRSGSRRARRR